MTPKELAKRWKQGERYKIDEAAESSASASDELLACPFCGGDLINLIITPHEIVRCCWDCSTCGPKVLLDGIITEREAIKAASERWNMRAS